jgi:hypothetical protein
LRPIPEAEDDPEIDSESPYDVSNDVSKILHVQILGFGYHTRNFARALLGFQHGNGLIELLRNEKVSSQSNQA